MKIKVTLDLDENEKIKVGDLYAYKSGFMDGTVKTQDDFDNAQWYINIAKEQDMPYIERAEAGKNAQNGLRGIYKIKQ